MFITLEGIEGCGKSTQAERLYRALKSRAIPVIFTREPGGTRIGEEIRKILLATSNRELSPAAEFLLMEADRAQHIAEVIKPALKKGMWVVCDRFFDATVAYQGYGRGVDLALVERLNHFSSQGIVPDKTFLLDCPVEIGLSRAMERNRIWKKEGEGRFEDEDVAFHQKVRQSYLELAKSAPGRFVVLDATRGEEELEEQIFQHIAPLVKR